MKLIRNSCLLIILFPLSSCWWYITGHPPEARYCFLDTKAKKLYYTRKDKGIRHVKMVIPGKPGEPATSLFDGDFNPPADSIDLSGLDTAKLNNNTVLVRIWDRSPVIEDYDLELKPGDWMSNKIFYCDIAVR